MTGIHQRDRSSSGSGSSTAVCDAGGGVVRDHLRRAGRRDPAATAVVGKIGVASTGCPARTRSRSWRISSAVWYRLSGFFASARMITASRSGETSRFSREGGTGCSSTCFEATATGRVADERRPSGDHLVQHAAERVDVGAAVDGLPLRLLGRQVRRGPEHRRGLLDRLLRVADPRDAEVRDLHVARRGDHDVAGLDVAVDDALVVRGGERVGDVDRRCRSRVAA